MTFPAGGVSLSLTSLREAYLLLPPSREYELAVGAFLWSDAVDWQRRHSYYASGVVPVLNIHLDAGMDKDWCLWSGGACVWSSGV